MILSHQSIQHSFHSVFTFCRLQVTGTSWQMGSTIHGCSPCIQCDNHAFILCRFQPTIYGIEGESVKAMVVLFCIKWWIIAFRSPFIPVLFNMADIFIRSYLNRLNSSNNNFFPKQCTCLARELFLLFFLFDSNSMRVNRKGDTFFINRRRSCE